MTDRDRIIEEYRKKYPPLLTPEQAAEIAQRPMKTIYDWSHRNLLDSCKVPQGRNIRFVRDCFVNVILRGF